MYSTPKDSSTVLHWPEMQPSLRIRRPIEMSHPGPYPTYGDLQPYVREIERHGCLVTASDTCYGVFCAATDPEAIALVRKVSGSVGPLPVTVGSVRAAAELLCVSEDHQGFLSQLWPGAFMAVARATRRARKIASNVNPAGGTVGVRVTRDNLEAELARECDVPIVSTAVRYQNGAPVRVGVHALRIVGEAMTKHEISEGQVIYMKYDGFRWPTHSTVGRMTQDQDLVTVLREGVYSSDEVRNIVRTSIKQALAPNIIAPLRSTPTMRSWVDDPQTLEDVT